MFCHCHHATSPVPMKIRVGIKYTIKLPKFKSYKYLGQFAFEIWFKEFKKIIIFPMNFHRSYPHIDFAIVFSVQLPMNIDVQDRHFMMFQSPKMQRLVKWTICQHALQKVVGIHVFLVNYWTLTPNHKWIGFSFLQRC